jgi:hypothetical protein
MGGHVTQTEPRRSTPPGLPQVDGAHGSLSAARGAPFDTPVNTRQSVALDAIIYVRRARAPRRAAVPVTPRKPATLGGSELRPKRLGHLEMLFQRRHGA